MPIKLINPKLYNWMISKYYMLMSRLDKCLMSSYIPKIQLRHLQNIYKKLNNGNN